ncbi:MAG: hypothetical protein L0H96_10515 [Humibacillus sp.]|nr:hypothetical protein [Humibacillus sp.]MDN5777334.1 hypothetical protein [Humibacillus sp.]
MLPGLDANEAAWFAAEGRAVRNANAHGAWAPPPEDPGSELRALRAICAAALRELFAVWDGTREPSRALVDHLKVRLEEARG